MTHRRLPQRVPSLPSSATMAAAVCQVLPSAVRAGNAARRAHTSLRARRGEPDIAAGRGAPERCAFRGDELPDELVDRLFNSPSGEALEIPAWHEGGEEPFDVAALAGALNTDGEPVLALFVFDEICLLYSRNLIIVPWNLTSKSARAQRASRSSREGCISARSLTAVNADEDDTWTLHSRRRTTVRHRPAPPWDDLASLRDPGRYR